MITIYKITNPNGSLYIGQTKDLQKRKNLYKIGHCKRQQMLYNSLKKYGYDNHKIEAIDTVGEDQADEAEIRYIQEYSSYWKDGNGMNLTRGGFRPKQTQETRDKISTSSMGSKHFKAKKLYQYDLDGNFIKEWECMKCIERELGYVTTWLSKSIKNNKIAYGYKWFYTPLHIIQG